MKNEKIAKVLKEHRKQSQLSVHDVALRLSQRSSPVAEKTVYGWESGQSQPDADTLLVLCDIYEIEDILETFGYKNKPPLNITSFERELIVRLRNNPQMLPAVKKLLDMP